MKSVSSSTTADLAALAPLAPRSERTSSVRPRSSTTADLAALAPLAPRSERTSSVRPRSSTTADLAALAPLAPRSERTSSVRPRSSPTADLAALAPLAPRSERVQVVRDRSFFVGAAFALFALTACGETTSPDASIAPDASVLDASDPPADAGFGEDAEVFVDAAPSDAGEPPLGPVNVDLSEPRAPDLLSTYAFFRFRDGQFEYNDRVVPYDLNTALFSDYAVKARAIYVPPGETIPFDATEVLELPVGSAVVKSFLFPADLRAPDRDLRLIETRVLVRYADGWRAFPYLWREDLSDADYFVRGQVRELELIDPNGQPRTAQYLVPQRNQCLDCHQLEDEAGERYLTLVGPRARNLNRTHDYDGTSENQLEHLSRLGMLTGLPPIAEVDRAFELETLRGTSTTSLDAATITRAARDYLDVNCAHCHRPNAVQGMTSRLFLQWDNEDAFHLGVCKEPGSAGSAAHGRRYDIVPGDAEASILVYRIETEVVGDMMPLIGRSLAHDLGPTLVRAWVNDLPPGTCN